MPPAVTARTRPRVLATMAETMARWPRRFSIAATRSRSIRTGQSGSDGAVREKSDERRAIALRVKFGVTPVVSLSFVAATGAPVNRRRANHRPGTGDGPRCTGVGLDRSAVVRARGKPRASPSRTWRDPSPRRAPGLLTQRELYSGHLAAATRRCPASLSPTRGARANTPPVPIQLQANGMVCCPSPRRVGERDVRHLRVASTLTGQPRRPFVRSSGAGRGEGPCHGRGAFTSPTAVFPKPPTAPTSPIRRHGASSRSC